MALRGTLCSGRTSRRAAAFVLMCATLPGLAAAAGLSKAEADVEAAERLALLRFRNSTVEWEQLVQQEGPRGLPGWDQASPQHHCHWGGVACCRIEQQSAFPTLLDTRQQAVCSIRLELLASPVPVTAAATEASRSDSGGGSGVSLEPLLQLEWLEELDLRGISIDASSLEALASGEQPARQLWQLTLSHAFLNDPLPPRLFMHPSIKHLDLSHSGLLGPLPPIRMWSLQEINLAGNQVTGTIPLSWLVRNATRDAWPLGDGTPAPFDEPLTLNLSSTALVGPLPELPPGSISVLEALDVSNTPLNATLPASWADASPHIILLDLSNTSARGAVPHSWWTSIGLLGTKDDGHAAASLVVLAGNQLTGTVPLSWLLSACRVAKPGEYFPVQEKEAARIQQAMEQHTTLVHHDPYTLYSVLKYLRHRQMMYNRVPCQREADMWPGNDALCIDKDKPGGWSRAADFAIHNLPIGDVLQHRFSVPSSGASRGGRAAPLLLLALAVALAALGSLVAGRLVGRRRLSVPGWLRKGYVGLPVRSSEVGSSITCSSIQPTQHRQLELAVRAVERAQTVGEAVDSSEATTFSHASSEDELLMQQPAGPASQQIQQGVMQTEEEDSMPLLAMLPLSQLTFPKHNGQPLALGGTGSTKVMLGRLEGVGEVAVKALHVSPQQLSAARREVALLRRCANRHTCVVTVHGLCYAHPFLLVVTELCSGGDLQSVLRHPELRWYGRGGQVALDVCRGMAFMHSQGVVWADCKPGNVLLTADWRAKVTDLGTSRLLRGTSTAQVAATLAYAAPEQLLNGRVSLASDAYSLGLALYDICCGEQAPLHGHQRRSLVPGQDCPAAVLQAILRCLSQQPGERPTAAQVAETLQASLTEQGPDNG